MFFFVKMCVTWTMRRGPKMLSSCRVNVILMCDIIHSWWTMIQVMVGHTGWKKSCFPFNCDGRYWHFRTQSVYLTRICVMCLCMLGITVLPCVEFISHNECTTAQLSYLIICPVPWPVLHSSRSPRDSLINEGMCGVCLGIDAATQRDAFILVSIIFFSGAWHWNGVWMVRVLDFLIEICLK